LETPAVLRNGLPIVYFGEFAGFVPGRSTVDLSEKNLGESPPAFLGEKKMMTISRPKIVAATVFASLFFCCLSRGQTVSDSEGLRDARTGIDFASTGITAPADDIDAIGVKVAVDLSSPQNGLSLAPGQQIDWTISARVSAFGNHGLAMISVDLVQDPTNPVLFALAPAGSTPQGMEGFNRPGGITNPDRDDPWGSGYGGTPTGPDGESNLRQIGGAQNTLGVKPPALGLNGNVFVGQDIDVDTGVGQQPGGQTVAAGSFTAPQEEGLYLFYVESAVANVLTEVNAPPLESRVTSVPVAFRNRVFGFYVTGGKSASTGSGSGCLQDFDPEVFGETPSQRENWPRWTNVILPPEGAELNRIHMQFRWAPFEVQPQNYTLWIEERTDEPFGDDRKPLLSYKVDGSEPRTVITSGLEFGKSYQWCVTDGEPPTGDETIHRFSTQEIPPFFPEFVVTRPPGAGPVEPGLTLFNIYVYKHAICAIDEFGEAVYFISTDDTSVGDVRLLPNGLLRFMGNKTCHEITLEGTLLWINPKSYIISHDATSMPSDNILSIADEYRMISGTLYIGNRLVEFDRVTKEETWSWSTFDYYSLNNGGPLPDWVHGNAAFYNESDGCVYFSSRHFSRITRIDYSTGSIVYNMGYDWPDGSTHFGHNLFTYQHAPQMLPNGNMMVYDNGNYREPLTDPRQTKAIELAFDAPSAPTSADIVWEFPLPHEDGSEMYCGHYGDADRLPGGNTLVTGGPCDTIFEVDANADLVWRLTVEGGGDMYRAQRIPELILDSPCDTDGDWDVDINDFAEFQVGATLPEPVEFPFTLIDYDKDGDIDEDDVDKFVFWMTGPT